METTVCYSCVDRSEEELTSVSSSNLAVSELNLVLNECSESAVCPYCRNTLLSVRISKVVYDSVPTVLVSVKSEPVVSILLLDTRSSNSCTADVSLELDVDVLVCSAAVTFVTNVLLEVNRESLLVVCEILELVRCECPLECLVSC